MAVQTKSNYDIKDANLAAEACSASNGRTGKCRCCA